jgi:hypothetical protein
MDERQRETDLHEDWCHMEDWMCQEERHCRLSLDKYKEVLKSEASRSGDGG